MTLIIHLFELEPLLSRKSVCEMLTRSWGSYVSSFWRSCKVKALVVCLTACRTCHSPAICFSNISLASWICSSLPADEPSIGRLCISSYLLCDVIKWPDKREWKEWSPVTESSCGLSRNGFTLQSIMYRQTPRAQRSTPKQLYGRMAVFWPLL